MKTTYSIPQGSRTWLTALLFAGLSCLVVSCGTEADTSSAEVDTSDGEPDTLGAEPDD
jgi:hypothetical protein